MSKKEMRKQLAALSFSEKLKILEKLRDRSLALAACGLRRKPKRQIQSSRKHRKQNHGHPLGQIHS